MDIPQPSSGTTGQAGLAPDSQRTYDLRLESWIPFRRRDGRIEHLPPWGITDGHDGPNPIVALAAPRPDLNGALHELLIGLFSVALALPDMRAWRNALEPQSPETLRAALMALPPAFNLDGDGPRFLQDLAAADFAAVGPTPVENLLIDAAGENTQKLNKDLFVKRGRIARMGRAGAAMALFTLQAYAPSGGQGHRTSMRGGGPLTTLVDPRETPDQPMWSMIAANLMLAEGDAWLPEDWTAADGQEVARRIWPWLAPARTSNAKTGGGQTTQAHAHPMQALFGMPRRIRLDFDYGDAVCDLLGATDGVTVASYRTLNFGIDYGSGLWKHPLSPHYKSGNLLLPVHPQPDGLGWKDWAGVVLEQADGKGVAQEVADVVARAARSGLQHFQVRAFGFDMDNMKARGWADHTLPTLGVGGAEEEVRKALASAASAMVEATRQVANLTVGAIKASLFERAEDAKGDFSHIKSEVWAGLEGEFYRRIEDATKARQDDARAIVRGFDVALRATATDVFGAHVDLEALELQDTARVVTASHNLAMTLRGYGKAGEAVFKLLGAELPAKPKAALKKDIAA